MVRDHKSFELEEITIEEMPPLSVYRLKLGFCLTIKVLRSVTDRIGFQNQSAAICTVL